MRGWERHGRALVGLREGAFGLVAVMGERAWRMPAAQCERAARPRREVRTNSASCTSPPHRHGGWSSAAKFAGAGAHRRGQGEDSAFLPLSGGAGADEQEATFGGGESGGNLGGPADGRRSGIVAGRPPAGGGYERGRCRPRTRSSGGRGGVGPGGRDGPWSRRRRKLTAKPICGRHHRGRPRYDRDPAAGFFGRAAGFADGGQPEARADRAG